MPPLRKHYAVEIAATRLAMAFSAERVGRWDARNKKRGVEGCDEACEKETNDVP